MTLIRGNGGQNRRCSNPWPGFRESLQAWEVRMEAEALVSWASHTSLTFL